MSDVRAMLLAELADGEWHRSLDLLELVPRRWFLLGFGYPDLWAMTDEGLLERRQLGDGVSYRLRRRDWV